MTSTMAPCVSQSLKNPQNRTASYTTRNNETSFSILASVPHHTRNAFNKSDANEDKSMTKIKSQFLPNGVSKTIKDSATQ